VPPPYPPQRPWVTDSEDVQEHTGTNHSCAYLRGQIVSSVVTSALIPNFFVYANRLSIGQRIWVSSSQFLLYECALMEKNFKMLGCICTARDFFVLPFSALHLEVLELPHGRGTCASTTAFSTSCGGISFKLALCSRCLASSHRSAVLRALLGFGIGVGEVDVSFVTNSRSSNFRCIHVQHPPVWATFDIFLAQKSAPWEKYFYCCKHILLIKFSQKILKKIFWRWILSHACCREVVSGTVAVKF